MDGDFDITKQGRAGEILSHSAQAIKELARDHRPMDIHFSAAEPSRVNAYAHLMRRLAGDQEMSRHYVFLAKPGPAGRPGSGFFSIVHRAAAHLPDYQDMLPIDKDVVSKILPPGMKRGRVAGPGKAVLASNLPPGMVPMERIEV